MGNKVKTIVKGTVIALLVLLAGCAKNNKRLELFEPASQYTETKNGVNLTVKRLTPNNYSIYTKKKLFRRYVPVEITVDNHSNSSFKLDDIGAKLTYPHIVARKLHKSAMLTFIWPLAIVNPLKAHIWVAAGILAKYSDPATAAVLGLLSLLTTQSLTIKDNAKITDKFKEKTIGPESTVFIPPNSVTTKVIYIRRVFFRKNFYAKITNCTTGDPTKFNINLE